MKLSDTFTYEEVVAAFSLLLPRERAEEEAKILLTPIDAADERGVSWFPPEYEGDPRIYSEDLLDLLSLVSDEAAAKAWVLLGVTPDEGTVRRERYRERLRGGKIAAE